MFDLFGIVVSWVSIILFVAGMVLLLIEMFMPGFGIFGGLGLLLLALCIVFSATSVESALLMTLIIGAIVILLALIFARSLKKGFLYKSSIVLKTPLTAMKDLYPTKTTPGCSEKRETA